MSLVEQYDAPGLAEEHDASRLVEWPGDSSVVEERNVHKSNRIRGALRPLEGRDAPRLHWGRGKPRPLIVWAGYMFHVYSKGAVTHVYWRGEISHAYSRAALLHVHWRSEMSHF